VSRYVALATAALLTLAIGACDDGALVARGIVIDVQQTSVAHVDGFTLRTDAGEVLHFVIGDIPVDGGSFPAVHLHDHLASAQPIAVRYVVKGDQSIVLRLADAP
jgi:hypothetical protein